MVPLVRLESVDQLAVQVLQDLVDQLDHRDHKDLVALQVNKENVANREKEDKLDHQGPLVKLVLEDLLVIYQVYKNFLSD